MAITVLPDRYAQLNIIRTLQQCMYGVRQMGNQTVKSERETIISDPGDEGKVEFIVKHVLLQIELIFKGKTHWQNMKCCKIVICQLHLLQIKITEITGFLLKPKNFI